MTGVLIKRGNLDTESHAQREYDVKRHGEKTAIYKPRILLSTSTVSHSVVCPTLCDPTAPPGSSVHGILQAKILEWVAIPFSRRSSRPRDRTWASCVAGRFFTENFKRHVKNTRAL